MEKAQNTWCYSMKTFNYIFIGVLIIALLTSCRQNNVEEDFTQSIIDSTMKDSLLPSDIYLEALNDSDEYVRSQATIELFDLEPMALEACLQTIDDGSSEVNIAYTSSMARLKMMRRARANSNS